MWLRVSWGRKTYLPWRAQVKNTDVILRQGALQRDELCNISLTLLSCRYTSWQNRREGSSHQSGKSQFLKVSPLHVTKGCAACYRGLSCQWAQSAQDDSCHFKNLKLLSAGSSRSIPEEGAVVTFAGRNKGRQNAERLGMRGRQGGGHQARFVLLFTAVSAGAHTGSF